MDAAQFDRLTRLLGTGRARRTVLHALVAASAPFMLLGRVNPVSGKKKKKHGKKGKHKKRHHPSCDAAAKPTCDHDPCADPFCDVQRQEWFCQDRCEGTSKPKCSDGVCVNTCENLLGSYECGRQCCTPGLHSECCGGTCCRLNEVCITEAIDGESAHAETVMGQQCQSACPEGKRVCPAANGVDWSCCGPDQACCNGGCYDPGTTECGEHCCGEGETCSNDWCCPPGRGPRCGTSTLCCNNPTDFCHGNECCLEGVDICGETCCPSFAPRCSTCPDGKKTCCAEGLSCRWDSAHIGWGCM